MNLDMTATEAAARSCAHIDCDGWMSRHTLEVVSPDHDGTYRAECSCGWLWPVHGTTSRDTATRESRKHSHPHEHCDGRCAEWGAS